MIYDKYDCGNDIDEEDLIEILYVLQLIIKIEDISDHILGFIFPLKSEWSKKVSLKDIFYSVSKRINFYNYDYSKYILVKMLKMGVMPEWSKIKQKSVKIIIGEYFKWDITILLNDEVDKLRKMSHYKRNHKKQIEDKKQKQKLKKHKIKKSFHKTRVSTSYLNKTSNWGWIKQTIME